MAHTQVLTYQYKLLPTKAQHRALERILEDQRQLYNAALEERIECYRKTGKGRSYVDQCKGLTECRHVLPDMAGLPLRVQRATLDRLACAYKAFANRVRIGASAGFPRFKGKDWFNSFGFRQFSGIRFSCGRLRFSGMPGALRMRLHRQMPEGRILSCQFKRGPKGWCVGFQVRVAIIMKRAPLRMSGIDMGLDTLAALSTGTLIANPRPGRKAAKQLRIKQRALARRKKGSARRRKVRACLAGLHAKIGKTRSTYLHQVSARLVRDYDLIAIEALNVHGLATSMLSRSVHDAAWGTLTNFLRYKTERAGVQLIEVDPWRTSQECPECQRVAAKTLDIRVHDCPCGYVANRDVAAARVILNRAVAGPRAHNVTGYGERGLGNLGSSETLPLAQRWFGFEGLSTARRKE